MENTAATTEPTAEAPASPAPEAPKVEEKPSSNKLLDLAKREADFAKKEVARKEEIAKLQERLKSYEDEVGYFRNAKTTYRENPEALLEKLGISYDDLTNSILDYYDSKEKNPPKVDADSIRKEIETQFRKQEEAKAEAVAKQAVESFAKEIDGFVKENADKFPHLTRLHKSFGETDTPQEFIFSVVENYFNETGELLELATAAATAEEYFRDEWNKLNGVLSGKPPESKPVETKSEKIVPTPEAPKNSGEEVKVSHELFKRSDRQTIATITNNLAKPVSRVPYKGTNSDRSNAIDRAVAAMEAAARRPR